MMVVHAAPNTQPGGVHGALFNSAYQVPVTSPPIRNPPIPRAAKFRRAKIKRAIFMAMKGKVFDQRLRTYVLFIFMPLQISNCQFGLIGLS
jgi:hypothetical protein